MEQLEQLAESKIGHRADGMWMTTDGRPFYSRKMCLTVQVEIEQNELINRVKGGSDE